MVKGIGCDVVSISRFAEKLANEKFVDRIFTENENKYRRKHYIDSSAGIWAGKESVSKALGVGFVGINYKDIEILHDESGQPFVKVYNNAQKLLKEKNVESIYLSISHDGDCAMAFVVLE